MSRTSYSTLTCLTCKRSTPASHPIGWKSGGILERPPHSRSSRSLFQVIPEYRAPLRNLYLANTTQIYPKIGAPTIRCGWDRL